MVQQRDSLVVAPKWECGSWPCQLGGSRLRIPSVLVHDVAAEESGFKWEGCRGSLVVFERDAGGLVWVGELCWAELGVLPPDPGIGWVDSWRWSSAVWLWGSYGVGLFPEEAECSFKWSEMTKHLRGEDANTSQDLRGSQPSDSIQNETHFVIS